MRKLKLFFACLLMAVLSIGQVWAGTATATLQISSGVTANGNLTDDASNTWAVSSDGSYTSNNSYIQCGTNKANVSYIRLTTSAFSSKKITKVQVWGTSKANTNVSAKVIIGSVTIGTSSVYTTQNASSGGTEFSVDNTNEETGELTIEISRASAATGAIYFNKAIVTYEDGGDPDPVLESITISGDLSNKSYEEGQSIDFTGLTATGHYNNSSTADLTDDVEWSFAPALTEGLTSVTVTATLNEISGNKVISGLTVAEHVVTPGAYDIPTDNDLWGTSYSGQATSITTLSGSKNDVSITINKNTGSTMYVTSSQTRIYNGYTMIFSVPNGYAITALQFTADGSNWAGEHSADVGTMTDNKNWSGEANSVTISVMGTCRMKAVKVTYAVAAPSKAEAGLEYAEADQKKLIKLGDAFTAPTLVNPNNLTVAYTSNNTDVAEVNASTGAVTIKATGVAVITASFAGNDDYKAGSASYTIGVTAHAGTEADPYNAADVKTAIDVMGTVANAYASGIVSNVVTTTLPTEGYISFYFSADGATTGQQVEAYKCYGLNSAPFAALTDVKTGATVVITGTLKKFNSTYEFDANCHLVSYEAPAVPKTHIANDQANPYTVAQAIAYAADGVTYDLDDYVYVQGVVYDVKSFNNGAMNIFIKDANAENQFELYKCAGINDGNSTTPFEALTDVQAGNIVIGYGQLTVFNTTYEFKQGNYIVDLQKPVTGVELDKTEASVEEEATVTLTATILPSNATGTIVWSVESGSDKASVDAGVVTGIAEGEAVIRATVQGTEIYAECTVTVTEKSAPVSYDYALVTDAAQLQDGLKVIIVAANEDKAAGSAAATYRNVVDVERTTGGNYLILDTENMPTEFTLGVPAAGQYTFNDGDGYMYESAAKSVKVQTDPFNWSITIGDGNIATIQATNELRYNSGSPRFTTYASGQQALQLYVKDDGKQAAGLAWSTDAVELTVGDEFTAPTLTNPNNIAAADITIASNNTELAVVNEGVVSLVENATGEATITATFAGNDDYRAASVSYTITVNTAEPPTPPTYDYALVTDAAQLQDGLKVIIVAAEEDKAAGSAAATYRNVVDVERTTGGNYLILDTENMPTEFTLGVPAAGQYTFNDGDGYMYESAAKSVKVQTDPFNWSITIGDGNIATIQATNELRYNSGSPRFTTYASGQQALQLYVKDDGKQAAGLAWSTDAVELTVGDEFTAPTLTNPNNIAAADITIASNNTELAVVNEGVVSLVENATGEATITATFAGNDDYRAASVSYTITVNAATPTPVETKNVVILAEYNSKFYAMTNSLASGALAAVEVEKDGDKIVVFAEVDKAAIQWTMTDNTTTATFQDSEDKYLAHTGTGTSLVLQDAAEDWTWDSENGCYYMVVDSKDRAFMYYKDGIFKNYATSNLAPDKTDYSGAPEIIEIAAEDIILSEKAEPQLAYTPAEVTLTVGDAFTQATLTYVEGFDGLAAVTYASNNEGVATVDESGVVSLVADAIGTATITATFAGNNNYLAGSASYVITVNEAGDDLSGTWTRVTSVAVGQKIIIAGTYNSKTMAMGKQNSNNRAAVLSALDGDVLTPGAATKVFTLVDAGEGLFAIQASNGKYLDAAGTGSSNYLREADDFEAASAKWTITFDENGANVVATSTGNRNVIRYNSSNGSELFSCYAAGGQRAINIYSTSAAPEPSYTEVRNGLTEGWYYTMCLDRAVTAVKAGSIWRVLSKAANGNDVILEEVTGTLDAGRPYIFRAAASTLEVAYTGDAVLAPVTEGNNGLVGSFTQELITESATNFIIYENALYFVNSEAYVGAHRAYLDMTGVPAYSNEPQQGNAPRRRVTMAVYGEQTTTGIDALNAAEAPVKVLINGQMYILRGEKMYNVNGQVVK